MPSSREMRAVAIATSLAPSRVARLSLLRLRQKIQQQAAPALAPNEAANQRFLEQLPFTLTAAQQRVADEIRT